MSYTPLLHLNIALNSCQSESLPLKSTPVAIVAFILQCKPRPIGITRQPPTRIRQVSARIR